VQLSKGIPVEDRQTGLGSISIREMMITMFPIKNWARHAIIERYT